MYWPKVALPVAAGTLLIIAAGAAVLFRYQPLPNRPGDTAVMRLWDRFTQRECVSPRPETTDISGIACSRQEIADLQSRVNAAAQAEQHRADQAAENDAYRSALATAGSDTHLVRQVEALRQHGFPASEIGAYVLLQQLSNGHADRASATALAQARGAGYSDAQIRDAQLADAAQADRP